MPRNALQTTDARVTRDNERDRERSKRKGLIKRDGTRINQLKKKKKKRLGKGSASVALTLKGIGGRDKGDDSRRRCKMMKGTG